MKKILFTMLSLMFTMSMWAGSIKVKEGDASFMKNSGTVAVSIDWSNAKWNNEGSAQEHWADKYQSYVDAAVPALVEGMNAKSKGLQATTSADQATYIMNVQVTNVDMFFSAMSVVPGNKHKIWATVTVTEKATGKVVCVYNVDEFKGGRDFSVFDSFTEMMKNLGKELGSQK